MVGPCPSNRSPVPPSPSPGWPGPDFTPRPTGLARPTQLTRPNPIILGFSYLFFGDPSSFCLVGLSRKCRLSSLSFFDHPPLRIRPLYEFSTTVLLNLCGLSLVAEANPYKIPWWIHRWCAVIK
ncbi:hypothetical protein Salat_1551900 [Sesamum alatum]|uniref:Uncharacterized protein n=1 Tax=Sesamum alatum TaxID=300844 RepID=A0AAE1YD25_9LAMI|nr:hypothetical protein Salat_1551900 [Sesamum alatum]